MQTIPTRSSREGLTIERTFDAPREEVFQQWTDPERLKRWWVPEGATLPYCEVDLRVGGLFHYCMRFSDGKEFWGRGIYREIVPPERLVFVDSFSNERGEFVLPGVYGMSAEHPAEALVTITFESVEGGTRVRLHHEIPASFKERDGTHQGWKDMLARLARTLEA